MTTPYCQARVQVPIPLSQQAPNPDPKVQTKSKRPKNPFIWRADTIITRNSQCLFTWQLLNISQVIKFNTHDSKCFVLFKLTFNFDLQNKHLTLKRKFLTCLEFKLTKIMNVTQQNLQICVKRVILPSSYFRLP